MSGQALAAPPDTARRRLRVQVRATPEEGAGTFECLASAYNIEYDIGWGWTEVVLSGAFADAKDTIPVDWMHDYYTGPIGHGTPSDTDVGLIVRGELYLDLDPFVARIYRSMVAGAVDEWSVAFYAQTILNDAEKPRCDQIVKGDLFAVSPVYRGANPITATLDLRTHPVFIEGDAEAEVVRLRSLFAVPDLGSRERKAEPVHHTGTDEGDWDGPANEKNLSNDDGEAEYSKAYAWVDPDGDPDTKAAYKFIHHFVADDGKVGDASTKACSSGIGVLNGGRGGTTIPDADVQGVYDHLKAHLSDAGLEAPQLNEDSSPAPSTAVGFRAAKVIQRLERVRAQLAKARADAGMDTDDDEPDPGDLAQALDAVIDEIADALEAGDLEGASDLAVAADSTSDDLLESLGVADDDEGSGEIDTDALSALLSSRAGRALVASSLSPSQPSNTQ